MPRQSSTKATLVITVLANFWQSILRFGHWLSEIRAIGSIFLATMITVLGVRIMFDISAVTFGQRADSEAMTSFANLSDAFLNAPIIGLWTTLRLPILLGAGVILPLVVFIINWSNFAITAMLQPYFLLVGAQLATLVFGMAILGQGAPTIIGMLYSLLRFVQLTALMEQSNVSINQSTKHYNQKVPPWFYAILRMESMLWLFNAAFLVVYIFLVSIGLSYVGLDIRIGQ